MSRPPGPGQAPLTALLVVQATLFHTIRSAVQRVIGVTTGVLAAVAVAAYVPFSWWVLGLLIAATLAGARRPGARAAAEAGPGQAARLRTLLA